MGSTPNSVHRVWRKQRTAAILQSWRKEASVFVDVLRAHALAPKGRGVKARCAAYPSSAAFASNKESAGGFLAIPAGTWQKGRGGISTLDQGN